MRACGRGVRTGDAGGDPGLADAAGNDGDRLPGRRGGVGAGIAGAGRCLDPRGTDVSFAQAYAFDTATFSSAAIDRRSGSTVGFHVGADIAYYFTDTVGAGWLTRYSRDRLELPSVGDDTLELETGGLHTAWGLRMRF